MPEHIVCFLSRLHHGLPHAFLILALISLIERTAMVIDVHRMHTLNCLITAALCSLVYLFRVEALFKWATFRHAHLCQGSDLRVRSRNAVDLQDSVNALNWELFAPIEPVKKKMSALDGLLWFTVVQGELVFFKHFVWIWSQCTHTACIILGSQICSMLCYYSLIDQQCCF